MFFTMPTIKITAVLCMKNLPSETTMVDKPTMLSLLFFKQCSQTKPQNKRYADELIVLLEYFKVL